MYGSVLQLTQLGTDLHWWYGTRIKYVNNYCGDGICTFGSTHIQHSVNEIEVPVPILEVLDIVGTRHRRFCAKRSHVMSMYVYFTGLLYQGEQEGRAAKQSDFWIEDGKQS